VDLHNIPSPGRTNEKLLPDAIRNAIEKNPYLSATGIVQTRNIALTMLCCYLKEELGMRYCHMRLILQLLSVEQKVRWAELAKSMLSELMKQEKSGFHFLFTGDEFWMFCHNPGNKMWVAGMCDFDHVREKSHFARKVMIIVFLNGGGEWMVYLMDKDCTMHSHYLIPRIVSEVAAVHHRQDQKPHQRRCMVHFDSARSEPETCGGKSGNEVLF
jgi:hypothetical protein